MHFGSGEKYALLGRRKICDFGPTKNMYFWSGEKYVILGRRKICGFGPTKNMYFGADEKYVILGRRKICTFGPAKNMYFWSVIILWPRARSNAASAAAVCTGVQCGAQQCLGNAGVLGLGHRCAMGFGYIPNLGI